MLELINRARANPAAEGQRLAACTDADVLRYYNYYHINKSQVTSDFAGYAPRQPLAFNRALMDSSREQSLDQASHGMQSHVGSDGSTFDQRIVQAGYNGYSALGENVYAYVTTVLMGYVGLNVDWGVPSLDHRMNLMNYGSYQFKEVGISIVSSGIKNFGPNVVTQDFGTSSNADQSYLVGVVYADTNGNGQYDPGEGLGGVVVAPDSGDYYAVTSSSGGFAIPLPAGGGTMNITASGGGLSAPQTQTVNYGGDNVKVDFVAGSSLAPTGGGNGGSSDPAPVVAPSTVVSIMTVSRNAANGRPGAVRITRTGTDLSQPLVVPLSTDGTAVAGVDYQGLPGSVTIPARAKYVNLNIVVLRSATRAVRGVPPTVTSLLVTVPQDDNFQVAQDTAAVTITR